MPPSSDTAPAVGEGQARGVGDGVAVSPTPGPEHSSAPLTKESFSLTLDHVDDL
jgi:hypothetical protein